MEREHLIIIAIVLIVLWMLMGHSSNCNCSKCRMNGMPNHIRYEGPLDGPLPQRIRYADGPFDGSTAHIRMSDKYFGATQHIQHHLRRDNKRGLLNGLYAGSPQHIRYGCEGQDCVGQV
jgi:hypothetical protein